MKKIKYIVMLVAISATLFANTDPLPSWNSGEVKSNIVKFVEESTNEESKNYIEPQDRIATFDNDGTLWSEQPMYFQLAFTIYRVKMLEPTHPEFKTTQPFKAILEGDMKSLKNMDEKQLMNLITTTHSGMSEDEFTNIVKEWMSSEKHPKFNRYYNELVFQPMLELLNYLRENDFKNYIVSGGGGDFVRPWATAVYGIPSSQIVGSSLKVSYKDGVIMREPKLHHYNDGIGKPDGIHYHIGKHPVAAFGNSDGDLAMMQYTDANKKYKTFQLYVHHTDGEREYAYDKNTEFGKLDKGLDYAKEHGWSVVDMKKDWKVVYPFELKK